MINRCLSNIGCSSMTEAGVISAVDRNTLGLSELDDEKYLIRGEFAVFRCKNNTAGQGREVAKFTVWVKTQ